MHQGPRARPALHFAPQRGWMNDPNGLIQWSGRVHLFYQHNPSGCSPENMAWGHASSTDLWTWEDHPLALQPHPAGPDRDGCFSGCAVVPHGKPHLLYTGVDGASQLPCLAEAADENLIRWTRYGSNPVIASPPQGEAVRAFRDHSAWWAGSMWYQVVGGGLADRGGALFLYQSEDLRSWEYLGVFAAAADYGLDGGIWECPDVFAVGDTVVVTVSVCDGRPRYAMWMTGRADGRVFTPQASGRCDGAGRYYAPQSLTLADGRRVAFGWLQESIDELAGPDRSRVGVMSLPRELTIDDAGALRSWPARELDGAHHGTPRTQLISGHATLDLNLSVRSAHATEIRITPLGSQSSATVIQLAGRGCEDIKILVAADGIQVTEGNRLLTAAAIPGPRGHADMAGQQGQIRVYYDGGVLEVFATTAGPAAVICNRHGTYGPIDVDLSAQGAGRSCAASVTTWSCGLPSAA